ncbi:phage late control D family protein [Pseudonocardia sp.]|uniref:phage late control D family protein n=1 Tax=Pseudonocardia sp. TaxID=60912 RepID=UPI003D11E7A1
MSAPGITVADMAIRLSGRPLPLAAVADVESVTVTEDLEALSMFTLVLHNWDQDRLRVSWSDSPLFALGAEVEIALGAVGDLHRVLTGEITGLEPTFGGDRPPMLTVRGYDRRHRLARGRRTRTFSGLTDSAIVTQVATGARLRADVTDTGITSEHVVQHNQTDLEFLRGRAERNGYELLVLDDVLHFHPRRHGGEPAAVLEIGREIAEFGPRLSTMDQLGELTVRGWDTARKEPVVGRAAADGLRTMGGTSGPGRATGAFGAATAADVTTPVRSKALADRIATKRFEELALGFVRGEAWCTGLPKLRAGDVVEIRGAGTTFSGRYYLTAVTHSLTPGEGYRTRLDVRRNAT